jgi:hypothetical protein
LQGLKRRRALAGSLLIFLLWSATIGCREEVPPLFRRNRPPETTLTVIAEEGTTAFYRYHVYWRGEDPDGEVVRYLFAITDTLEFDESLNWDPSLAVDRERGIYTAKSDSVFLFNSDAGRQVINIVAIDDYGELDPSPARSFFKVINNGLPTVRFIEIAAQSADPRVLPCAEAVPCTIPTYTNFHIRMVGSTANGAITGYTWQTNFAPWEPYYSDQDTFFLDVTGIRGDTTGFDLQERPRWQLNAAHDSLTILHYSTREEPAPQGNFTIVGRVRDSARALSLKEKGTRFITVNFDPETRGYTIPECDCPNAPPGCAGGQRVPMGWITGIGLVDFAFEEWRPFCPNDTLPLGSRVRFYADGSDDTRDVPFDPELGLKPVTYSFRFAYSAPGGLSNSNMTYSDPVVAVDLPLQSALGGGTFHGAATGWQTCPFDYRFEAGALDENGRLDGTPAEVPFFVSGSPSIDSVYVPKVLVLVPQCPQTIFAFMCDPWNRIPPVFGPDTLAILGTHIAGAPGSTPYDLGYNEFILPFRAWGHDHPRDRNPPGGPEYYAPQAEGRIRSWNYIFDCVNLPCDDEALGGERNWREDSKLPTDPPGEDVFDDPMRVTIQLDTLCLRTPCGPQASRAVFNYDKFGRYAFVLQGRDTEAIGQTCQVPSDLGPTPAEFFIPIADRGRTTQVESVLVDWRPYSEVRRISLPAQAAGKASPLASRQRWKR